MIAHIDLFPVEVDLLVGGGDLHVNMAIECVKTRQSWHKPADRKCWRQLDS
jgi:hypothetical protein